MGIQGLLPLLSSIQQPICLSELSGSTVGVDVYCWLHKGAYGCALELAEGNDSDVYIKYVMRRVNMMLYYKVKPILVFDGGYLPSKGEKEAERRQRRKESKTQGLDHLKKGNRTQALEYFQKSIDITPEMALNVVKACREKGVDCIVAPYEADAQLAYLMKTGITQCTISEDSDLLVFGCEKVIFKMDANGSGLMIDLKQLPHVKGLRMDGFTQQKFREMCILSGCDYLQSVKGMGLITAHKMVKKHSTVRKVISTLRLNTKMNVPNDYETRFEKAEQTFLYQVVFDPNTNKLVPLNPLPDDIDPVHLFFAGHGLKWKQEDALDLAIGNLNPLTGTRIGNFNLTKYRECVCIQCRENALSFDEHENDTSSSKENKSSKTSICPQVKKKSQHSVLSSNKTYEAERNLNGAFRDTKSSEKANNQFVTPVRSKRSRTKSDTNERKMESSKLARLYSTSMAEVTVDVNFETTETTSESAPQFRTTVQPRIKKMLNNPFRSPVIRKPQCEQVVSRYFGLSGMEVEKNEMFLASMDNTAKTNDECSFTEPEENTTHETQVADSQISNEQDDNEFHESGYLSSSQPIENSPTDNCTDSTHSPPFPTSSPPLLTNSPPLLNTLTNFPSLRKYSSTPTSRNNTKQKPRAKKSTSNQISLDMFAYAKVRTMTNERKKETVTSSPKRAVLADRSPPNCKLEGDFNERQDVDIEDENKKENCRNILGELRETENKVDDMPRLPCLMQDESKTKVEVKCPGINMARTQPKIIGLRKKPTTGLGRCRAVGLGRRRKNTKDTASKTINNDATVPLLKYFEFRGRDRTSHGIAS